MGFITGLWMLDASLIIISSLLLALYLHYQKQFRYWKNLNVPHTTPVFPTGNVGEISISKGIGEVFKEIYDSWKGHRFVGFWSLFRPILLVRDPELIKAIMVKDFMSFHDRGIYVNEKDDPLAAHLFSIGGTKWRNLRMKLTPTFTSGKMKLMFSTFVECGEQLKNVFEIPASRGEVVEVKDIVARFTTDIISSCAFGIQTNSLKNPDAIFRTMGRKVFEPSLSMATKSSMIFLVPQLAEFLKLCVTPKEVTHFFMGAIRETMDFRQNNHVKRNDFLQLMIELIRDGKISDVDSNESGVQTKEKLEGLTFEEAAAQVYVFFLAGFETSSTTLQFALYELALNPDIQEKTREEVNRVLAKNEGKITYEGVHSMDYLGRVIDETLRKYPPVPFLQRECNRDYRIPGSDVVVPAGTSLLISVFGQQNDPEHFPNPEKFDPDRFTEEGKAGRHHYVYLPFGEGPRNCIGMRFGLMQTRLGLAVLLSNFRFHVSDKTPIPMVYDPKSLVVLTPKYGMHLKVTKL